MFRYLCGSQSETRRRSTTPPGRWCHGWWVALMLWAVWSFEVPATAQPAVMPVEHGVPYFRNYSRQVYRAHSQNWGIVQDLRGVMYFANGDGILEYDGVSWRLIPIPNESIVRSLAVDASGRIYVGAQDDFGYLEPDPLGEMRFRSLLDRLEAKDRRFTDVWRIVAADDGVYFGTNTLLFRWNGERITVWEADRFYLPYRFKGQLYIQQRDQGLFRINGDVLEPAPDGEKLRAVIFTLLPYDEDRVLIGIRSQGFWLYDGQIARPFATEVDQRLREDQLYHGAVLADGRFALATLRGGVLVMDRAGQLQDVLDKVMGLQDDQVWYVYTDREGGLWLGLNNGISRVEVQTPFTVFGEGSGLRGSIQQMVRHRGTLYVVTSLGVYYQAPAVGAGDPVQFLPVEGLQAQAWAALPVGEDLLVSTVQGVYQMQNGRTLQITEDPAFALRRSHLDSNRVFIGLKEGLASIRRVGETWVPEGPVEGPQAEVRHIVEDAQGRLWLGTMYQGIERVDFSGENAGEWPLVQPPTVRFDTTAGLPEMKDNFVYTVADRPVFSTEDGLYRFDEDHQRFMPDTTFGQRFADGTYAVSRVVEDREHQVWMTADVGATTVTGVARPLPSGGYFWDDKPFGRLTGFKAYDIYPDVRGDHVVWFGGPDGLVRYDPNVQRARHADFTVLIRSVAVRGDSTVYAGADSEAGLIGLRYKDNALRFVFAAPSFDQEERNQYQYYLDGFDQDWSEWTEETQKDYTNLPEGEYRFQVRAQNVYGVESQVAGLSIEIMPPWYRSWWAFTLYLVLLCSGLLGVIKTRTVYLRRQNKWLEQQINEGTEEIRRQKRAIEQANQELADRNQALNELNELRTEFLGIAAHDLKNPLHGIRGFSNVLIEHFEQPGGDLNLFRGEGLEILQIIQGASDRMFRIIRNLLDTNALESGQLNVQKEQTDISQMTQSIVEANRVPARTKNITLHFTNGEACIAEVDVHLMREAIDNLVNNAVKFSPLGMAVWVRVDAVADADHMQRSVRIAVRDEGEGICEADRTKLFAKYQRLSARPTGGESSSGLGLFIVKKIVDLHDGRIHFESAGQDQGSTFVIEIPQGIT